MFVTRILPVKYPWPGYFGGLQLCDERRTGLAEAVAPPVTTSAVSAIPASTASVGMRIDLRLGDMRFSFSGDRRSPWRPHFRRVRRGALRGGGPHNPAGRTTTRCPGLE